MGMLAVLSRLWKSAGSGHCPNCGGVTPIPYGPCSDRCWTEWNGDGDLADYRVPDDPSDLERL